MGGDIFTKGKIKISTNLLEFELYIKLGIFFI